MKIKSTHTRHAKNIAGFLLGGLALTMPVQAASISLASTMDGNSYIAEDAATGGFSRINLGDGGPGDWDGHYLWDGVADPASLTNPTAVGSGWDLFPREANFLVGSLTYDEGQVSLTGISTVLITSIDLSEFWKSDPNRTNPSGGGATVESDISDYALGLWFFNGPGSITFGALDANDTLTFTDGVLTAINLDLSSVFTINTGFGNSVYEGTFSISGADISYQIDDTADLGFLTPRLVANITGTVNALAAVPEPSTYALGAAGVLLGIVMLRRRKLPVRIPCDRCG